MDHVEDFITATGNGLGRNSDQIVENCHSALNKRLTTINYWIKISNLKTMDISYLEKSFILIVIIYIIKNIVDFVHINFACAQIRL